MLLSLTIASCGGTVHCTYLISGYYGIEIRV
jgi:hypothetical protein